MSSDASFINSSLVTYKAIKYSQALCSWALPQKLTRNPCLGVLSCRVRVFDLVAHLSCGDLNPRASERVYLDSSTVLPRHVLGQTSLYDFSCFCNLPCYVSSHLFTARRLELFRLRCPSEIIHSVILARRGLSAIWTREPLNPIDPARHCCRGRRRQVPQNRRF